jgi:hypothetical protein
MTSAVGMGQFGHSIQWNYSERTGSNRNWGRHLLKPKLCLIRNNDVSHVAGKVLYIAFPIAFEPSLFRNCHSPMIPSTIRLGKSSGAIGGAP